LGTNNDKFVSCPPEALRWETRRWRLLEEILRYQPDLICLQEVDHFRLLSRALASVGYSGRFVPKPDSPCIYLEENNGPDGCAIFVRDDQFEILGEAKRVLEVWKVASNQVVLLLNLRHRATGREVAVATTHLKARNGALLSTLRNEQGKDLLAFLSEAAEGRPLVLSGDFNADPAEPVYQTLTNASGLGLRSAYTIPSEQKNRLAAAPSDKGQEPEEEYYTTWKIRETGEQKQVLDYIFHSEPLRVGAVLEMPTEAEIGADRLPSLQFPSDHLSLVADFLLAP
jgi:nocturnin